MNNLVYINHRPVFGIASEKIEDAFRVITQHEVGDLSINRFLSLLMNKGKILIVNINLKLIQVKLLWKMI